MVRPDVAIVGGGIVGAATADALSAAGLSVVLIEADFPGGGASAASMGHVLVLDGSAAELALCADSRRRWSELAPELPADCQDGAAGTLWVAADEEEMAALPARATLFRRHGAAAEILDEASLARAEPELRRGLPGALFVPEDRVLYPPAAARFLLARAVARGSVRVMAGEPAVEIGAGFVRTATARIEAGAVINAAGCAAPALTPGLAVVPRKGHLAITDRYPGFCHHQILEMGYLKSAHGTPAVGGAASASVAFNLQPRATGQLLLGSSRERVGLDRSLNRPLLARMIARAASYVPRLPSLSVIRTWVGFRPATPDNLPLIGPWPETPGLWIATGHEGLGITTSLGTARLLADGLLGRRPAIDPAPYLPARALPGTVHG
jgi:glycine/D-amino acid oxidase-like deaminating enzyme